jgi:hypothetical protein
MTTYTTSDDGGVTSRPMNETEIATYEAILADIKKEKASQDKAAADKASARQAVLDRLGISADEAALLLG